MALSKKDLQQLRQSIDSSNVLDPDPLNPKQKAALAALGKSMARNLWNTLRGPGMVGRIQGFEKVSDFEDVVFRVEDELIDRRGAVEATRKKYEEK